MVQTDYPLQKLLAAAGANAATMLDAFLTYIIEKKFELYPAQEEAILALFDNQNVILNTPTGSGKSLVAVAMHFASLAAGKRSYYTCPIKALVNEKFLALCRDFGPEQVGMVTGDASVNPTAPIICCTAEILSNIALREGGRASIDDVIMDEFHYYSDRERGVAWQIPLLTMPQARFMLMSATLGDVTRFERCLTTLNKLPTLVVRSIDRPVPLNFSYQEVPLHETVHDLVNSGKAPVYLVSFTQRECAEEAQSLMSVDLCTKEEKQQISALLIELGIKFSSPYGKELLRILKHGIGIHHAGLLPKYRYVIERLAQKGLLKIICGTDTLGVGVNVPIRTVLFSKLCKFDGEKSAILSVRDFHQIAGRAGRKGFDVQGSVVVQAPEHVIENMRLESKAGGDPKKLRKITRKKPPERGFIMWTKDTFEKLIKSEPEPLQSRFSVSHGMLLNVLSRPDDGCSAMRKVIRDSHESLVMQDRHRSHAFKLFRSLVDRKIIEFIEIEGQKRRGLRVNVDLQEDFSLHHAMALYLLDTVKHVDPYAETYALDILTLAESIVENPEVILRRQLDAIKRDKINAMKAEGVPYEERMAEIEHLEYPKPNREFIYATFNEFAEKHPWIGQENIRPKSIAREIYEQYMTFGEYVREYDLQRSEGLLLRYLSEVYKVLVQTVPERSKDEEMQAIIEFFGVMVRQVDSSLLDEWEKLKRNPAENKNEEAILSTDALLTGERRADYDITRNRRDFETAIRNEVFQFVKAAGSRRVTWIADAVRDVDPSTIWNESKVRQTLETYSGDHDGPLTDRTARGPAFFQLTQHTGQTITARQILIDAAGHNDWALEFAIDIPACREAGAIRLNLIRFSDIGSMTD